ncbi:MAG: hypothetical protein GXY43_02855 [Clostridiaceae bacterium]|nr:hypothetical protein [Clostridiaceae bacterium]
MQTEINPSPFEIHHDLAEIVRKQNRLIRFQSAVQSLILILLIGATAIAAIFFFKVQATIDEVDSTLDTVDAKFDELDMDSLNNSIIAFNEAAAKIEGLDASTINDSVVSLNEAAKTFSEIDTEQINELTKSLNNTAQSIEKITDKLANPFS